MRAATAQAGMTAPVAEASAAVGTSGACSGTCDDNSAFKLAIGSEGEISPSPSTFSGTLTPRSSGECEAAACEEGGRDISAPCSAGTEVNAAVAEGDETVSPAVSDAVAPKAASPAGKTDAGKADVYVRRNPRCPVKYYSTAEVRKHCTRDDCWLIVDGKVYDATQWLKRHPGGELLITSVAGLDVTDAFLVNHLPWVREKMLPLFQIGYVADYTVNPISKDFRELAVKLEEDGWYETDYWYYAGMMVWYTCLFLSSLWCILYGKSWPVRVVGGGILMAGFWQQLAFAGHDLGHMAVSHNRVLDTLVGNIFGNFFMGITLGWWKATHNVHHLVTNYLEYDPDIQHLPVLAINRKFFNGIFSYFHNRRMEFDRIAQFFVARQHWLYYPIMAVARFNLYFQSFLILLNRDRAIARGITFPRLEMVAVSGFYYWVFRLCMRFPTWKEMWAFIFLSHAAAGLLHVQICISHFPMEVLDNREQMPLEKLDYASHQFRTCLDVDCPAWFDWFHGGLQFQTPHHLFPMLPRHRLREAIPLIQKLADDHKLTYYHVSFIEANRWVIRGLKKTADGIHPWLVQLLNAEG